MRNNTIKHAIAFLALFVPMGMTAQASIPGVSMPSIELDYALIGIIIVGLVGALATIVKVIFMMLNLERVRLLREHGIEASLEAAPKPTGPSALERFWKKMQGAVPVSREKDILFDHSYDGIRELDNKLPPWWVGMFYVSIVFAIGYLWIYHVSDIGLSSSEKYELEMERAEEAVEEYRATLANQIDESNVELSEDPAALASGMEIFKTQCAVCHGQLGEGGVGPNFTDEYWIHGGDVKDLFKTIKYGVPAKGMISWQAMLSPSQMQQVASYILTLQGTDPPNQKEPEGELYRPVEAMLQDTAGVAGD